MSLLNVFDKRDLISVYPEIYILIASSLMLSLIIYYRYNIKLKNVYMATIFVYMLCLTILLYIITIPVITTVTSYISCDILVISIKIVLCIVFLCIIVVSREIFKTDSFISLEYIYLFFLLLLGLCLFISSFDFLFLYLTLELMSLNLYLLALFTKYSNFSTESALKYFLLSSVASSLLLFGASLFYGLTGSTNFNDGVLFQLNQHLFQGITFGIVISLAFISSGLFFKVGFFPYFIWIPDVYSGVNVLITAIYSTLPKLVSLILILKLYFFIFSDFIIVSSWVVSFSIVLGLIFGSLGALYQVSLKRLWGFSAVAHISYIMTNLLTLSALSFYSVIFYIIIYIIIALNFFLILFVSRFERKRYVNHLNDLRIFSKNNFILGLFIVLTMFSLSGIPPLAGFFSKLMILLTLCNTGDFFLCLIIIIFSVISSMYYLRILRKLFFKVYSYYNRNILYNDISFYTILSISILNIFYIFNLEFIIMIFNISLETYFFNKFDIYLSII